MSCFFSLSSIFWLMDRKHGNGKQTHAPNVCHNKKSGEKMHKSKSILTSFSDRQQNIKATYVELHLMGCNVNVRSAYAFPPFPTTVYFIFRVHCNRWHMWCHKRNECILSTVLSSRKFPKWYIVAYEKLFEGKRFIFAEGKLMKLMKRGPESFSTWSNIEILTFRLFKQTNILREYQIFLVEKTE